MVSMGTTLHDVQWLMVVGVSSVLLSGPDPVTTRPTPSTTVGILTSPVDVIKSLK